LENRVKHFRESHGWSQGELAAQAGTTAKAIESKLGRIRKRLRQTLGKTC